MDYIIFDIEWNQPCYKCPRKQVDGVELSGEIIQLGAVKLSRNFDVTDSFETNIEPVFYKKMNRSVSRLTGITESTLRGCLHFGQAYAQFRDFCGEDYCLLTWGRDDIPMLIQNMDAHGLDSGSLPDSYDLQLIFNHQITHSSRQRSLSDALEMLGIEQRHPSHNALFDAVNTAKVALSLDLPGGICDYGKLKELNSLQTRNQVYEGYATLHAAISDKSIRKLVCPLCNTLLEEKKWIGGRGKKVALSECPNHGMLKFSVTAYHADDGFCAVYTVAGASNEMIESYRSKLTAVK